MSDLDKLNHAIRQTPLLDRLEQARRMIFQYSPFRVVKLNRLR